MPCQTAPYSRYQLDRTRELKCRGALNAGLSAASSVGAYATLAFIPPPRAARSLAAARSSSQMVSGLAMYTDE